MSVDILVKYKGFMPLKIELNDLSIKNPYKQLVLKYSSTPAISRDQKSYNSVRLRELSQQAKDRLGWDWIHESYPLDVTTKLHKDIEIYLARGFAAIPKEFDDLLHELHYALHAIQGGNNRGKWLQVEWFNDDSINMPAELEFTTKLQFGDVKLQNPYVGHDPAFIYMQQDSSNIAQTCQFHDIIKPGINIMIQNYKLEVDTQRYLAWFKTYAPGWYAEKGASQITRYTGWPKVGHVLNLDVLQQISDCEEFVLENIRVL